MKKLYILAAALLPVAAMAQEKVEPVLKPNVYALHMSQNGKWLGSAAGDASIYNVATGENVYYDGCFFGLGNAVSNNGIGVGESTDIGVIMYNGKAIYPESIGGTKYTFCDINSITSDGKYICGIISNPGKGVAMVPFIAEIDESLNVSDPYILPHPEKDFFGAEPQFITAVYISEDGKIVVGNVQDWRGMYSYPVYFVKGDNGEWSYVEPTKSLFNPTGIDIPENPWLGEPPFPEPENFMTGTRKDAFLQAFELYATGAGQYPYPEDYMTDEQYDQYVEAVAAYNKWYYGQEQAIKDYIKIYAKVLQTTPAFSGNDMAMAPNGEFFMMNGSTETPSGEIGQTALYKFITKDGSYETMELPAEGFFPYHIATDGTVFLTKGMDAVPTTMILVPGTDTFVSMEEYFEDSHPEISEWLETNVPGGTGVVLCNEDKTFFTGALVPDQLADYDWDAPQFYYSTYFIQMGAAGVESILDEPVDGVYKAYNLQGVKMLETKDASLVNTLPEGLYIVNGKKVYIKP